MGSECDSDSSQDAGLRRNKQINEDRNNLSQRPTPRKSGKQTKSYKPYDYEELPKRRGAIRLLKLHPNSEEDSDIQCELVIQPHDYPIRYEALSWCWGADANKVKILIRKNGRLCAKRVSPNLVKALRALRRTDKDRYLWIDAICINQENLTEKNHQVEMMYDIYGKAHRVCIWLGEGSESSDRALGFIKRDVLQLQNFDDLCNDGRAWRSWSALLELMQRPWFSRRWVVQEIALAKQAVIYCGSEKISWKKFAIAVELFVEAETATHRLSEVMEKNSKHARGPRLFDYVSALGASLLVNATNRLFRDYRQEHALSYTFEDDNSSDDTDIDADDIGYSESVSVTKQAVVGSSKPMRPLLSLEYLVSSLTIFNTSVPSDTIYALLAISKDTTPTAAREDEKHSAEYASAGLEVFTQRKKYNVDYNLHYVDVCKEFIEFAIQRSLQIDPSRALDVICRPWATEQVKLDRKREAKLEQESRKRRAAIKLDRQRLQGNQSTTAVGQRQTTGSNTMVNTANDRVKDQAKTTISDQEIDLDLPSWVPQLSGAPFGMFQQPGVEGFKMSRKNADPLVGPPDAMFKNYSAAETKKVDMKSLKFRRRSKLGHYSMYVRGFELDEICTVEYVSTNGGIPKEWTELAGWAYTKGPPPEAFWRTLVADRGSDGKNPPVYYSRACEEAFKKGGVEGGAVNTTELIDYECNSVVSQFCRRVQAVTWNRALVKTAKGRLGLVSKGVKEGDLVCILYGLSVPVILHRSERKSDDEFLGEVKWESEYLRRMIAERWKVYKKRKAAHRKGREWEMARYFCEWLKTKIYVFPKDKILFLQMCYEKMPEFQEYRRDLRTHEWPAIKEKMKQQKARWQRGFTEPPFFGKKRMDEIKKMRELGSAKDCEGKKETQSVGASQVPRETQSNGSLTSAENPPGTSETPTPVSDSMPEAVTEQKEFTPITLSRHVVDWWEFGYMLKAGRRWLQIVRDRNGFERMREKKSAAIKEQDRAQENSANRNGRATIRAAYAREAKDWEKLKEEEWKTSKEEEWQQRKKREFHVFKAWRKREIDGKCEWVYPKGDERNKKENEGLEPQYSNKTSDQTSVQSKGTRSQSPLTLLKPEPEPLSNLKPSDGPEDFPHSGQGANRETAELARTHPLPRDPFDVAAAMVETQTSVGLETTHLPREQPPSLRCALEGANEAAEEAGGAEDETSEITETASDTFGGMKEPEETSEHPCFTLQELGISSRPIDEAVRSSRETASSLVAQEVLPLIPDSIYSHTIVRPSWIKKAEREACEKRRNKTGGKTVKRDEPMERVLEEIEASVKAAIEERLGEDGRFYYKLMGECYIHGAMDGEAMLYQNGGDEDGVVIPSMVFELR